MAKSKSSKQKTGNSLADLAALLGTDSGYVPTVSEESWNIPQDVSIPLQVLKINHAKLVDNPEQVKQLLEETARADQGWDELYKALAARVESMAAVLSDGIDENGQPKTKRAVVTATLPGYARVGGFPGFNERLLPVMHPVYGIPYVPASSIKGMMRAWARSSGQTNIDGLLGFLDGENAGMAKVQILDAFPVKHCLKVDVATPQWAWANNEVKYGPSPHSMLSLENVELKIGLCQTSKGTVGDVEIVLDWLGQALGCDGLGGRISAGYGRVEKVTVNGKRITIAKPSNRFISRHKFEFWSQGMYGINPPTNQNGYSGDTEFRASSVRGIIRYWFRAIALDLFPLEHCQTLEHLLFGTLEPKSRHGHIRVSLGDLKDTPGNKQNPHHVSGEIILECKTQAELTFLESLLKLATHLGGVGRGSRRPLHINMDGDRRDLRGCNWQLTDSKMQISYDIEEWIEIIEAVRSQLKTVKEEIFKALLPDELSQLNRSRTLGTGSPGIAVRGKRLQDVINSKTRIYLIKTPNIKLPPEMGWDSQKNRGSGLSLFYDSGYKGQNRDGDGNINVGGAFEIPSFVWITTNSPSGPENIYQVITVFGADQRDRKAFSDKVAGKVKKENYIMVWPR